MGAYELTAVTVFDVMAMVGVLGFVGVHVLAMLRIIGGDGLIFFSGNTVAAALLLSSNFDGVNLTSVLVQIACIAFALILMIVRFCDAVEQP